MKLNVTYIRHDFVALPEIQAEVEIDPVKLAFIIVDMQNDFLAKGSMFEAKGVDMAGVRKIIEPTRQVAEACRGAGAKVIYTQHSFRPDLSDMGRSWRNIYVERPGTIAPGVEVGPRGERLGSMVKGTWNAAIIDELTPHPGDILIENKHKYTAFYQTDLELILHTLGIEWLLFAGVTTGICVESTLRDAFHRDFLCILLADCTWEKTAALQAASETHVKCHFGYVTSSHEAARALAAVQGGKHP